MKNSISISEVNIVRVKPKDGLVGFCAFVLNESFYVGSVAIFSKPEGGIRLVYPKKNGIHCFHPINKEVGHYITNKIFAKFYGQFNN